MSEELLVNVTPRETRVAVVENGMLQELHIERGSQRGVVGNIYKGKVQRVMPGMQAAFVDIGLERAAFIHANDIFRAAPLDGVEGDDAPVSPPPQVQLPIIDLLRDGAEIVVQVVKDPIGSKGARLTTQISIPSRYLVLLPRSKVIGISAFPFRYTSAHSFKGWNILQPSKIILSKLIWILCFWSSILVIRTSNRGHSSV